MWIKCPSGIGHPTPSVKQALRLIRLDCTDAEIELVKRVISVAVDKQDNRLFSD
ncbi:hypothetical protein M378DRAFT_167345, partial [Amanita muscaria Koide BX008]